MGGIGPSLNAARVQCTGKEVGGRGVVGGARPSLNAARVGSTGKELSSRGAVGDARPSLNAARAKCRENERDPVFLAQFVPTPRIPAVHYDLAVITTRTHRLNVRTLRFKC